MSVQKNQGIDEEEAIEILMQKHGMPKRPHSKMLEGRGSEGDEGGEGDDGEDEGEDDDSHEDDDQDEHDQREEGLVGHEGTESCADTYSESDGSLGESNSEASSFLSSRGNTQRSVRDSARSRSEFQSEVLDASYPYAFFGRCVVFLLQGFMVIFTCT